ncbi:MAG: hypothetical protein IKK00_00430 [Oscillospiraceae bacterium]|nr:hypothetical protein [Oscillospiraceae bacterium]MBR6561418.1 hypothetical protein [Oscillospiraceae bacterium]
MALTSMQRYQKMLSLAPYESRDEMPVFPMMLASYGSLGGILQKDIIASADKWIESIVNTFARVGKPDVSMPLCPGDTVLTMGLPSRLPGRELPDDALYQFIEMPQFDDPAEYKRIMEIGWDAWHGEIRRRKNSASNDDPEQLAAQYARIGENAAKTVGFLYSQGVVPDFDTAYAPIFDGLSLTRSMLEFTCDVMTDPGPIVDVMRSFQPESDLRTIASCKANGGWRVCSYAMRSSATFVSMPVFEEIVWPVMKASIERFHEAGVLYILHADANWGPMMKFFTEVPKGSVHIELDGATDIEAAYETLQGWQSIRGDVPSTMLAYDSVETVSAYCEKLIQMGMRGGYMLGTGCEVPLNAKPENVKAMISALRG